MRPSSRAVIAWSSPTPSQCHQELFRFLTTKKIRIKNITSATAATQDFDDGAGGGDDDDPYMHTINRQREV